MELPSDNIECIIASVKNRKGGDLNMPEKCNNPIKDPALLFAFRNQFLISISAVLSLISVSSSSNHDAVFWVGLGSILLVLVMKNAGSLTQRGRVRGYCLWLFVQSAFH